MSIQRRELEIKSPDGETFTYTVTQFDALVGRREFVKLANLLGPAFGAATSIQAGIGKALSSLDPKELDRLCDVFGAQTRVTGATIADKDGTPLTPGPLLTGKFFGEHFAGNYCDMFEWLVFCVTANYASFFSGIEKLVAKYQPDEPATKVPAASP